MRARTHSPPGPWALLLLAVATLAAAPTDTGVTIHVEPEEVTVGDRITVTLELVVAEDAVVRFPELGGAWGKLIVLDQSAPQREAGPAGVVYRKAYRMAAFEPGTLELPTLEVEVGEGDEARVVPTPITTIQVSSVLEDGAGELADIKPPAFLPIPPRWVPWLLALTAAGLLALAVWWWRRRRRVGPAGAAAEGKPPLPAAEEALAALEQLLAARLLEEGRIKPFHVELSEIVKRYVWRRFDVATLERTTFEVLRDAREAGLNGWAIDRIQAVLAACDSVKFARQSPAASRCRASAEGARDLVLRTRPVPAPVDAAAVAAEG